MIQKKWIFIGAIALAALVGSAPLLLPMTKVLWHYTHKPVVHPIEFLIENVDKPVEGLVIRPQTTEELKKWFAGSDSHQVPRVFVDQFPTDFKEKGDKKLFAEVISALILRENEKIMQERAIVFLLREKQENKIPWTPKETAYFKTLVQKYDALSHKVPSAQLADLNIKVLSVPPLMGVIQAAEATDWGRENLDSPYEQTGWLDKTTYARVSYQSLIQATENYVTEMNGMPPLDHWRYSRMQGLAKGENDIGYQVLRWLGLYKSADPDYTKKLAIRVDELPTDIPDNLSFIKPMKMQVGRIKIGHHFFKAEFARTKKERAHGLMFRTNVPKKTAMIFIGESPRKMGVWMKNTFVPLDVVFFDADKRITEIFENLKPLDETPFQTVKPALGMVELPAGTVKKRRIKVGDKISF